MKRRKFIAQCAHVDKGCTEVLRSEKPAPPGWTCEACEGQKSWDCHHGQTWALSKALVGE